MQISARNLRYLIQHQFDTFTQNFSEIRRIFFFRKRRFSNVMSRDSGSKDGQLPMSSRMYSFEAKRKQKTANDAQWNALQNSNLGISKFLVFDHPKSKFQFLKNKYLQNQNF